MPEYRPVTVETDLSDGIPRPRALVTPGQRRRISAVTRQWDRGQQRYFDVKLDDGGSALLCLDRRTMCWSLVDVRGQVKPA